MDPTIVILGIAGALTVLILVAGVFLTRRESDLIEIRLNQMDTQAAEITSFADTEEERERERSASIDESRRRIFEPLNNVLAERKFGKKWKQQLARANLRLTVAEYGVAHIFSSVGLFTAGFIVLFPGDIIFSTIAGVIGIFVPRIYVGRLVSNRLIAFETQLADTLGLWVNALRSGYSVVQAMEAIARDAPEPTMGEFQRVVKEVQIGIDLPEALSHLLERVESPDLDLVVTAVNIQREVGGNLAEILEVIAGTIRERIKLKGEIRVLTSQGRITGYLISFLPILLALFLNLINPGYMGELFSNQMCGWPMIGAGLSLIGMGTALIQKIVDIEI